MHGLQRYHCARCRRERQRDSDRDRHGCAQIVTHTLGKQLLCLQGYVSAAHTMGIGSEPGVPYAVLGKAFIESKSCIRAASCAHDFQLDVPVGLKTEPHPRRTSNAEEDMGKDGCEQQESARVS